MPVFSNISAAPAPTALKTSPLDDFVAAGQDVVQSVVVPLRETGQRLGVVKPKQVVVQRRPAWTDSSEQVDDLRVWRRPLPKGAILTHCRVAESVGYRSLPLSDVTPVSLEVAITERRFAVRVKGEKGQPDVVYMEGDYAPSIRRSGPKSSAAARAVLSTAQDEINKGKGSTVTANSQLASVQKLTTNNLAVAQDEIAVSRLRGKVGKVYLGDPEPRRAQLMLVLHDVVAETDSGSQTCVRTRHQVLEDLHSMFCESSFGTSPVNMAMTALSDAARLTASATAGHLVQLDAPSLRPYKVDQWLVQTFEAIERPDIDVIAVRVQLVEFISVLSAHVEDPSKAPEIATINPIAPVRPSYLSSISGAQP